MGGYLAQLVYEAFHNAGVYQNPCLNENEIRPFKIHPRSDECSQVPVEYSRFSMSS